MTEPTHRPTRRRRVALLAAVAAPAALAAIPAALSAAPTITTDAICLRPSQQPNGTQISPPLNVFGSGFPANTLVTITRGAATEFAFSDATGAFAEQLSVIDLLRQDPPKSTPVDIVATVPALGLTSNPLRIRTAPLEFSATPKRTRPSSTVTFRFSGFNPDQVIYAHYRYVGRTRANVRMGRASNPCGLLTVKRDQIPVRNPATGLWRIQFDHNKKFSPAATPRIEATVNVFRTFR